MVTSRSSTITSLVRKSAPIVALYWLENFLLTYWFIRDVLPTPESPRMITFNRIFLLEAIMYETIFETNGKKLWLNVQLLKFCLQSEQTKKRSTYNVNTSQSQDNSLYITFLFCYTRISVQNNLILVCWWTDLSVQNKESDND